MSAVTFHQRPRDIHRGHALPSESWDSQSYAGRLPVREHPDFWLVGDTECVNLSIQLGIVRPGQAQIWWFLHVSKKSRLIHGCFYGPLQHTLASDILFPILLHDILDSVVLWLVARVCYSHNCNQLHLVTSFSSQLVGSNMFILNNQRTGRLMILHEHFV